MFTLKHQYDRLVCLASIDTPKGKTRVNLAGTEVPSVVPATKFVPEKKVTIPGITQEQIKYIVTNQLAHWEKFQEVAQPVAKVEPNANKAN